MTPKEYKTFPNSLTPEEYKALVDNSPLKMSSEKHKILLVEALAHTLTPEEYRHFVDNLPPERCEAIPRRVVIGKTIKVLADTFVLLGRVREGSNLIHGVLKDGFEKLGDDPSKTLENIGEHLEKMTKALGSMPDIAADMGQSTPMD